MDLIIVESPNKVKTISQFLPKNYVVKASVGHITKVKDTGLYNLGIDVKGNFNIEFEVDDKKKDVVKELKELVKKADTVYVASDLDREGEAIAYHLKTQLNIPDKKCKRITYHEVTKKAIEEALSHPGKIDDNLVNAAFGRTALDKIIGYRLSPIAKNKVYCKSVGRCQSPALRLIVDREEEILNFDPKTYYEIWLPFTKDKIDYKAQYKGLLSDKKNSPTIDNKELAEKIVTDCKGKDFIVQAIESNDRNVQAKPPFTTSTYQQEVSSKLGYSVKKATDIAQKLFEGINIGGVHVPLCTYLRTDSTSMDPEFEKLLRTYVENNFGKNYLGATKKAAKKKNDQDGHECFRVIDLTMTPERLSHYISDSQMLKVYSLIYNRTLQSVMTDAIVTDTDFIIGCTGYKFIYTQHALKFDGWRKAYGAYDDEELTQALDVFVKEKLDNKPLELLEKKTTPPSRYTEAKLVKKLTDLEIGRPSTFASILSTLLDPGRGYAEEQGKSIAPTEKGIKLIHFLKEAFPDVVDYNYTAKMEESLDEIAKGKLDRVDYLKSFYSDLESMIKGARGVGVTEKAELEQVGRKCPKCGGELIYRQGRFGKFIACSNWKPFNKGCNYTERIE